MSEPRLNTTDQHTPGPWRAARAPINPWWKVYIEGHEVAEVEGGAVTVYNNPDHPAAVEANAYLIAAAPELLEVLRRVRDQIDDPRMGSVDHRSDVALVSAIRVAVAKAEGRS